MKRASHAFTLIELLVVISIVSLLISVLLPALASARRTAQRLACMTRMRQVSVGLASYTIDYKQTLPQFTMVKPSGIYGEPWTIFLKPYMASNGDYYQQWHFCPVRGSDGNTEWITYNKYLGFNNPANSHQRKYEWVRVPDIWKPGKTILVTDGYHEAPGLPGSIHSSFGSIALSAYSHTQPGKHQDTANYAFVDGHAQTIPKQLALDTEDTNPANGTVDAPFIRPFE